VTGAAARARLIPAPVVWGAVVGVVTAGSPLAFWWLDPSTVYALGLVLIASVYSVASIFVVVAAVAVTGSVWLVANTRWWPPFCAVVDWVAAAIIAIAIVAGVDFG
jgi:cytochrome bd-type quinol oxidase subunit 2